jgi:hypothetical protein
MPVPRLGGGVFESDPDGYREEFLYAVEAARALHDPAADWEGFRDALWANLTRVFGIDAASWPDVAQGSAVSEGDAAAAAEGRVRDVHRVGQGSAATPRA